MCTHLQRRGGRYFLRRRVPQDLQARYGRREITKALGTSDRRAAAVLCRRLGLELDDEFRLARAQKPTLFVQPVLPEPVQAPQQALQQAIAPVPVPNSTFHGIRSRRSSVTTRRSLLWREWAWPPPLADRGISVDQILIRIIYNKKSRLLSGGASCPARPNSWIRPRCP